MKKCSSKVWASIAALLMLCSSAWADIAIDEAHFPDKVFRDYVQERFDADDDGLLSAADITEAV